MISIPVIDATTPMGATCRDSGTTFRTWAPNAHAVHVIVGAELPASGAADPTPPATSALRPLGDGTWGGFFEGVGDGDPYLFHVAGEADAGLKRDPYARELTLEPPFPDCRCIVRDPASYRWRASAWKPPRFDELVIYQLHVGTFWAQDANGRDVRAIRYGTFLDVAMKLTHLADLGINAIQLLPVQEFETRFSLGYNGVDYFSPETLYTAGPHDLEWRLAAVNAMFARFGREPLTIGELAPGANQLRCLIDLCHLHGIAVILDLVYNHAGGGFDPQSLWFYDRQRNGDLNNSLYFTDQGWAGGQVFAYWNSWVSQFLIDNAVFFLREYRIDGIRYDEVRVIEDNGGRQTLQHLTDTVRFVNPSAIQIAEYWNPDRPSAVRPPPSGLGFDVELGDGLRDALRGLLGQLAGGAGAQIDLAAVAANLATPRGYSDAWRLNTCLENQDKVFAGHDDAARVAALADGADPRSWYARSRSRAVTAVLLTAPGIPALFMGQEFNEGKKWSDADPAFLIGWDGLAAADPMMRDFLRCVTDLVHLRRAQPALLGSGIRVSHARDYDRVLVIHRWIEGERRDIVVAVNFAETSKDGYSVGLPFAGEWRERFNSDVYEGFPNPAPIGNGGSVQAFGSPLDGFAASAPLHLPANGAIVLVAP